MSNFKDNKTPLSEKGMKKKGADDISGQNYDEFFENRFLVPKAIKDELEAKGLDCRFINYKKYVDEGHFHRSHWKPYKCDSTSKDQFGQDINGYIRRGDTILAVRTKDVSARAKTFLKKRNDRYKNFNKLAAEELRSKAREAGVNVKVHEGYEENE